MSKRNYGQRIEDKSLARQLYSMATPYIQVCGFIILCAFIIGGIWTTFNAYGADIVELKVWRSTQEERNNKQDARIARMEQNLQDIHDYLIPTPKGHR